MSEMTLLEKIESICNDVALGRATRSSSSARILALLPGPVMPPLVWGENEFRDPQQRLMLGGLYVGEIHHYGPTRAKPWRAWFSDECEGNSVGIFETADEARAAVEQKLREALSVPPETSRTSMVRDDH